MRVLIVEDEPVIALEIESIVLDQLPEAEIVVAASVNEAFAAIDGAIEMAFLDIDVSDGKTYPLALQLRLRKIPFVFVSGANRADAPDGLSEAQLIPKPFSSDDITRQINAFKRKRDADGLEDQG